MSPHRYLASVQKNSPLKISLSDSVIFANGVNHVFLQIEKTSEDMKASDFNIVSDIPVKMSEVKLIKGVFVASITPKLKSSSLKLMVTWKDHQSSTIELKTTMAPMKEKLALPGSSTSMSYVGGLTYLHQENFTEGLYEGFSIDNRGMNRIVSAEESMRDYEFQFEEQASQNISLMVSDAPNSTISHTMHSYFMFFPRKNLPYAEPKKDKVTVTLPTGEKMVFSATGEIIDGVFTEGPIDYGPDRFKRTYPNLKYQGKGILLRANARGQMPQQGQFENTKIDMEYGIKYSMDVLIINGTTGQRCRRPKSDFWPSGDISPIPFKFPTDKEFDTYLRAKCNFGIPDLSEKEEEIPVENVSELVQDIWSRCESASDVATCLKDEAQVIENEETRGKVSFDLNQVYRKAAKVEADQIPALINNEIGPIRELLLKNAGWISDFQNDQKFQSDCLRYSQAQVKGTLRFHDFRESIKDSLVLNCTTIKSEILRKASSEVSPLQAKLESDLSWASVNGRPKVIADCQKQGESYLTGGFRYQSAPVIYHSALTQICEKIEASSIYQDWLKTQSAGLEDKISQQVFTHVEELANKQAEYCLRDYPVDNQLNRMRYKKQREACLVDHWNVMESEALTSAKKDPLVQKVGLSLDGIEARLAVDRRRLQLKVMKKYFL